MIPEGTPDAPGEDDQNCEDKNLANRFHEGGLTFCLFGGFSLPRVPPLNAAAVSSGLTGLPRSLAATPSSLAAGSSGSNNSSSNLHKLVRFALNQRTLLQYPDPSKGKTGVRYAVRP